MEGQTRKYTLGLQHLPSEVLEIIVHFLPSHLAINGLRTCGNRLLWAKLQRSSLTCIHISGTRPYNSSFIVLPTLSALTDLEIHLPIPEAHQDFLHSLSGRMKRIVLVSQLSMNAWLEKTTSSFDGFEIRRPMAVKEHFTDLDTLVIQSKDPHAKSGWPCWARRDFLLGLSSLVELDIQFGFFEEEEMSSYLPPFLISLTLECPQNTALTSRLPSSLSATLSRLAVTAPASRRLESRIEEDYGMLTSLTEMSHFSFPLLSTCISSVAPLVRLSMDDTYRLDDAFLSVLPRSLRYLYIPHSQLTQSAIWNPPLLHLTFGSRARWKCLKSLPSSLIKLRINSSVNVTGWDETALQPFPHLTHLHLDYVSIDTPNGYEGDLSKLLLRTKGSSLCQVFPPRLTYLHLYNRVCSRLDTYLQPTYYLLHSGLPWLRHLNVSAVLKESQVSSFLRRLVFFDCIRLLYEDGSAFLPDTDRQRLVLTGKAVFREGFLQCLTNPELYQAGLAGLGVIGISLAAARSIPASVTHLKLVIPEPEFGGFLLNIPRPQTLHIVEGPSACLPTISNFTSQCVTLKSLRLQAESTVEFPVPNDTHWPQLNSTQLESIHMPSVILSSTKPDKFKGGSFSCFDPRTFRLPPSLKELRLANLVGPLPCFDTLLHLTCLKVVGYGWTPTSWEPESLESISSLFQLLPASLTSFEYAYQIPAESLKWLKCAPDHLKYFKTSHVSDRLVLDMSPFLLKLTCEFVVMEHWGEYLQPDPSVTDITDMQRYVGHLVGCALTTPMQLICLTPPHNRYFTHDRIIWNQEEITRLPPNLTKLAFSERCRIRVPRMAHLLPSSLTTLVLPACIEYILSTAEIRHLPKTLQTLKCSSKYFHVDSFLRLPASLTNLDIFGAKKFTCRFAAALPKNLRRLKVEAYKYFPNMVKQLPSTLTYLSVTTQQIPSTVHPVREDYPPNIEFLKLPISCAHIFPNGLPFEASSPTVQF